MWHLRRRSQSSLFQIIDERDACGQGNWPFIPSTKKSGFHSQHVHRSPSLWNAFLCFPAPSTVPLARLRPCRNIRRRVGLSVHECQTAKKGCSSAFSLLHTLWSDWEQGDLPDWRPHTQCGRPSPSRISSSWVSRGIEGTWLCEFISIYTQGMSMRGTHRLAPSLNGVDPVFIGVRDLANLARNRLMVIQQDSLAVETVLQSKRSHPYNVIALSLPSTGRHLSCMCTLYERVPPTLLSLSNQALSERRRGCWILLSLPLSRNRAKPYFLVSCAVGDNRSLSKSLCTRDSSRKMRWGCCQCISHSVDPSSFQPRAVLMPCREKEEGCPE